MSALNFIFSETKKTLTSYFDFSSYTDFAKEYTVSRQVNINNSSLSSILLFKRGIRAACTVKFISSTEINLLRGLHGYLVGQKIVLNSNIFNGVSLIISSIVDVNNFRCKVVNQTLFPDESGQVYLSIDNASYALPLDSKGNLRHGLYTINDAVTETGTGVIDTIVTKFSYCFENPIIDIVNTLDCGTAKYTVIDGTEYKVDDVNPIFQIGYELSLNKDNSKPVAISVKTIDKNLSIVIGTGTGTDLYAGSYTSTVKSGVLSYDFTLFKVETQVIGSVKYDVQCDKGICDIFCGVNTLRKNMENAKGTNPTLYAKLQNQFVLIAAYIETYYMAKKCKNETEASNILNTIKTIGSFTDNCCGGDQENYKIIAFDSCGCTDVASTTNCEPYLNSYVDTNVVINSKLEVLANSFFIRLEIQGSNSSGNASTSYMQVIPINYCGKKKIKLSRVLITTDGGNESYAGILVFNNIFGSFEIEDTNETSIIIPSFADNTFCILENTNFNMINSDGASPELPNGGLPTRNKLTVNTYTSTDLALGNLALDPKYENTFGGGASILYPIEGNNQGSGFRHLLRKIDQTPLLFKYKNSLGAGFNGKLTVILEGIII